MIANAIQGTEGPRGRTGGRNPPPRPPPHRPRRAFSFTCLLSACAEPDLIFILFCSIPAGKKPKEHQGIENFPGKYVSGSIYFVRLGMLLVQSHYGVFYGIVFVPDHIKIIYPSQ